MKQDEVKDMLIDMITEVLKSAQEVHWPKGFGSGTGYFNIGEEKYEIEFDETDTKTMTVRGIKFFRIINSKRVIRYTESKEPFAVAMTIKEQVHKYLNAVKPDVFGFMGALDESPRLRHYMRILKVLSSEHKEYNDAFTHDEGGERIFVLSKFESTEETLDNLKELRKELGKV